MNKIFINLHRWLGFPLGLLFIVTFGTGCLTAIDELLERYEQTQHNNFYQYRPTTSDEIASAIKIISEDKKDIGLITVPTESTPYYRVSSRNETWTYAIDDLTHGIHKKSDDEGFFRTTLQLHRNFLLGKDGLFGIDGKFYAVWVGLVALFLSVLGLWIWWPLRKSFQVKNVLPRGNKRKYYYYSHMTSGVVTLVVVILLSLTGASITYRSVTQKLFGADSPLPSQFQPQTLNNDWQTWIDAGYSNMPTGSQLTKIRYPRQLKGDFQRQLNEPKQRNTGRENRGNGDIENAPQEFSLHFTVPDDWLGLDNNVVKIDKRSSTLIDVSRFTDLAFSQKMYSLLKPLHTGHDLPVLYVALLLVFSLMGTVMVFSGLVSFVIKKRKWLKRSQLTTRYLAFVLKMIRRDLSVSR